jgi:uncharacterized damage-inducible protein DinB
MRIISVLPIAACACLAFAAEAPTVAQLYDMQVTSAERDVVSLAEAMPADKYDFAPTAGAFKGVRTFAQQVKHLAAVNYLMAAAAEQIKPPVDTGGESGPDSIKTKEQIVAFLKGSFAQCHKAARSLTAQNHMEMVASPWQQPMARGLLVTGTISHSLDHYGQMVVYARMNGIVPPASK